VRTSIALQNRKRVLFALAGSVMSRREEKRRFVLDQLLKKRKKEKERGRGRGGKRGRGIKPIVDVVALVSKLALSLLKELANLASLHGGRRTKGGAGRETKSRQ